MSEQTAFEIFCIEGYKVSKNLDGKAVLTLFNRYGVFEFIEEYYDILRDAKLEYVLKDISIYIEARRTSERIFI